MEEIFSSDDDNNVSSAAAVAMLEEGDDAIEIDDDDLEGFGGEDSLLEPQVILEGDEQCPVCQGPLSSHYGGQPCQPYDSGGGGSGHFLFDGESSESSNNHQYFQQQQQMPQNGAGVKSCPVCPKKNTNKDHVATHFMKELMSSMVGQLQCYKCDFQVVGSTSSSVALAKTLALHDINEHDGGELDGLLENDPNLVATKKAEFEARSNKANVTKTCPICDQSFKQSHARDHVHVHFLDELRAEVAHPNQCPMCSYTGEKPESVLRHLALYHGKLDEYLENADLVAAKRTKCLNKPKKVSSYP